MAVRGVYSKEEQKILEQCKAGTPKGGWLGEEAVPEEITYPARKKGLLQFAYWRPVSLV